MVGAGPGRCPRLCARRALSAGSSSASPAASIISERRRRRQRPVRAGRRQNRRGSSGSGYASKCGWAATVPLRPGRGAGSIARGYACPGVQEDPKCQSGVGELNTDLRRGLRSRAGAGAAWRRQPRGEEGRVGPGAAMLSVVELPCCWGQHGWRARPQAELRQEPIVLEGKIAWWFYTTPTPYVRSHGHSSGHLCALWQRQGEELSAIQKAHQP